jgi:hypothetical protein
MKKLSLEINQIMVQHNTLFLPSHGKTLLHVKLLLSFVINSLIKGKKNKQINKKLF